MQESDRSDVLFNCSYCFVQDESSNSYLVSAEFKDRLSQILGQPLKVLSAFEGNLDSSCLYLFIFIGLSKHRSPLYSDALVLHCGHPY